MIDWTRVETLREEVGAEEFSEVVDLFLNEVDAALQKMKVETSIETLEADMHFLKGSALSLGFRQMSELCQAGETASAHGNQQAVNLTDLFDCYERSRVLFLCELDRKFA
jgi:HPt (histidine-containing phosphotransfer) domain-containing protein